MGRAVRNETGRREKQKEDQDTRKSRKVAKGCVFPMLCGSGGSKGRLAKVAGAEPPGKKRDQLDDGWPESVKEHVYSFVNIKRM